MTSLSCSTTWPSMRRMRWTPVTRRTASWLTTPPLYRSTWRSTWEGHFQSLSVMSSSRMRQSAPTRKQRRGRLWYLRPVVLLPGTGRCTTTAPPTRLISSSSTSASSSSGFPAHLSASISRWHLGLYLHHHLCCACLCHRLPEPPLTLPTSTVAARATSHESATRPRKTQIRAMSPVTPTFYKNKIFVQIGVHIKMRIKL
jgi:hypothetical protein